MTTDRRFLYLPSGYKSRTNTLVEGVASTGEVSPKGVVSHTEDWEGRVSAKAGPAGIRLILNPDGTIRNMTRAEQLDKGYFLAGKGPIGIRIKR